MHRKFLQTYLLTILILVGFGEFSLITPSSALEVEVDKRLQGFQPRGVETKKLYMFMVVAKMDNTYRLYGRWNPKVIEWGAENGQVSFGFRPDINDDGMSAADGMPVGNVHHIQLELRGMSNRADEGYSPESAPRCSLIICHDSSIKGEACHDFIHGDSKITLQNYLGNLKVYFDDSNNECHLL